MNSLHSFFAGSKYTLLIILFFTTSTFAQAPMYYNYNTMGNGNSFPFSVVAGKLVQELILPGEFNQPTPAPSGTITKLYIYCATATVTFTDLTIKMHQDTITNLPSSGFYTGPLDTVYYNHTVTITSTQGTFTPIVLTKPFVYDNTKSLIIEISQCGCTNIGMTMYQTVMTGQIRRAWNQTAGGCNYIYYGNGNQVMNCGVDIISGPSYTLPDMMYYKFENNPTATSTPNYAVPGVGNSIVNLTSLTLTSGGQFDSCLSGTATSSAKITTGYSLATGTSSFTISMWLSNLPAPATTRYLFGDVGLSFRCFVGGVAPTNGAILRGTGVTDVPIPNIFPGPTVIHIVYDSAASAVKIYRNGSLVNTVSQTPFNFTAGTGFTVGGYSSSAGLEGLMDEFRFYKRALDSAEIAATWNIDLTNITGITPISTQLPSSYSLSQNYPNPFNPVTKINFAIPKQGFVTLKVYDMLGRMVSELLSGYKQAGSYSVDFNAGNLSSGVYFYRLEVNGFSDIKKMILVK
jgi:hypothetical protein